MRDILQGLGAGLTGGSIQSATHSLSAQIAAYAGLPNIWPMASGRAAMTLVLKTMSRLAGPERRDVIIPGYTCYSVAAAVVRAGLRPRLCDVDPQTLSMRIGDLQRFDPRTTLALISANLYGIPNDLGALESAARERGIYMLDDAAQSLGASWQKRPAGTFGDAGLYSFDKGKNITTLQGGVIVAREGDLAGAIATDVASLPPAATVETLKLAAQLPVYAAMLRPSLYGVVRRMPFLGLGRTVYEERYPVTRLSQLLGGLAATMFRRMPAINQVRSDNGKRLAKALRDFNGVSLVRVPPEADPVYVRFPFLVADTRTRRELIKAFDAAGIGATTSYPEALCDVPELADKLPAEDRVGQDGARHIARSIVTLPTHPYCPADMAKRAYDTLATTLARPQRDATPERS